MSPNVRGALLIVAAVCLLTVNDAFAKRLSETIPVTQVMALRGLIVVPLLALILSWAGQRPRWVEMRQPAVLLRGFLEAVTVLLYLGGLTWLPLATANALIYSSPLFATALAAIVLKERVTPLRWGVLATGFVGVLIVTDPTQGGFSWAILMPLVGAVIMAVADLINRRIDPAIGTGSIVIATTGLITLTGAVAGVADLRPFGTDELWMLAVMSLFLGSGYVCLIAGLRIGEISFSVPFRYVSIPFAMLVGWIVWGDVPTVRTGAGAALIVAGGVLLVLLDRKRGPA